MITVSQRYRRNMGMRIRRIGKIMGMRNRRKKKLLEVVEELRESPLRNAAADGSRGREKWVVRWEGEKGAQTGPTGGLVCSGPEECKVMGSVLVGVWA